jgi:hypothetical protein
MLMAASCFGVLPLAIAMPVAAFHHVGLPTQCAATASGTNASNNPTAKEAIVENNPAQTLPLPPVGTPSAAAETPAPEQCANP